MPTFKLLAIYGSPRKGGNTDLLLDKFLQGAAENRNIEPEKLFVRDMRISSCAECNQCRAEGKCAVKDDMVKIYEKLKGADGVALASPIFFYGLPGKLKNLIDRCQCYWVRKYVLKSVTGKPQKPGIFISAGATRGKNLFEGAKLTVKYFFDVFDIMYCGDLLVREVDKYQEILSRPEILEEACSLGRKFSASGSNIESK